MLQCGEVGGLCLSVGRLRGLCFSVRRLVLCASVWGGVGFVLQCGEFGRGGESSVQDDIIHRSCPKVAFEMVPMFVGLTMALSRKIVEHFHLLGFSPLLDSAMPMALWQQEGSQAPQHLRSSVMVALPSSLLCHFPLLWHVQDSTSTGLFKGGCQLLTHASLGF